MLDYISTYDIPIDHFKIFYFVAKQMSFSMAAKKLNLSQSAVSQSIALLESRLNQPLFHRTKRSITLTSEGSMLLSYIEPSLHILNTGLEELYQRQTLASGSLHIAASDTICKYYLMKYFKHFHEAHPNIDVQITNKTSTESIDLLNAGLVDLAITNLPNEHIQDNNITHEIYSFQDVIVGSPMAAFRSLFEKSISLEELSSYPLILLTDKSSTTMYFRHIFAKKGLSLTPSIQLGSIDLLMDMAEIGLGITIVPDYVYEASKPSTSLEKIIIKSPLETRSIGFISRADVHLSSATKEFIRMLESKLI